ncbi:FG-GAP repeat domain-containing protein [Actinacidiphila rubida]|uniref:Repeat domain-containing protein n=1 Tax=Actinacidiphila rubida TaxID=310780 RepID=A0A1H8MLC2_9ACTN|nr:VCBS repeat-containing protein [Actinacidiphila rubida]SEO18028.1 Repeat domain-containing protein [Actinacidiphila rubida]
MLASTRTPSGARRRLTAACTAGVLAACALALSPAGTARADSAPPHTASPYAASPYSAARPSAAPHPGVLHAKAPAAPGPAFVLPRRARTLSTAAAADALTTPRYDVDGDGFADFLTQEVDGTVHQLASAAGSWKSLGQSPTTYRDILTPGNLDSASAGPEILSLTTTGLLSMWAHTAFPTGTATWTGKGWNAYNKVVAVGDIDGDGFGDLLARTPSGDLYLYKGTGSATAPFAARVKVGSSFGGYDQLIGAGDIGATGHETLVARDLAGDLWMYTLDGTAADPLSARVEIGTGWNLYNQLVGIGDESGAVGGILGRAQNGDLFYYEGTGTVSGPSGTLTARRAISTGWNSLLVVGQGSVPLWGKNDLYAQTSGGDLFYYYGSFTGGVSARLRVGDPGQWKGSRLLTSVSLSQKDEEPLLEIYNNVLYNDTPGFTATSSGWGQYTTVFGPGDLNGDGRSDLLARDASGVLWIMTGKGDGTFYGRGKVGAGWGGYTALTGAGDINGDGLPDIVARSGDGHLYLYLGTGSGPTPFQPRIDIGAGWNIYARLASPGDLDGDGRADLVGVTAGGQLYRYSGSGHTGTATFRPRVQIGTAGWNGYSALF